MESVLEAGVISLNEVKAEELRAKGFASRSLHDPRLREFAELSPLSVWEHPNLQVKWISLDNEDHRVIGQFDGDTLYLEQGDGTCAFIKEHVRVEWVRLGEGWNGDYNEDDPDDDELLRFDAYVFEAEDNSDYWREVPGASYCTRTPVATPMETKKALLYVILNEYWDELGNDKEASVKKIGERLSWISPEDIQNGMSRLPKIGF